MKRNRTVIKIFPDLELLSRAAAEFFIIQARKAIEVYGRFSVALSGGFTPKRTYQLLSQDPFRNQVDWEKVHIFWCDERCVPPDDPQSNEWMAQQTLLNYVSIPTRQIYPIRCNLSARQSAERYEELLRIFFGDQSFSLNLVFLGLGENGHTASLFPNTSVLEEQKRWVVELYLADQKLYRVTLTPLIINQAELVIFLVSGRKKAKVLKEVLEDFPDQKRLPAQSIQPINGDLYWMLDEEAGSLLSRQLLEPEKEIEISHG
jgi:6-phosphogluconolactonase